MLYLRVLIYQVLLLSVALFLCCAIARGVMVAHYLPSSLWQEHFSDFSAMWVVGAKLDMRSIGITMLIFMAISYIAYLFSYLLRRLSDIRGGGGKILL